RIVGVLANALCLDRTVQATLVARTFLSVQNSTGATTFLASHYGSTDIPVRAKHYRYNAKNGFAP
ncbi:MAG: hypothetical protein ACK4ME_11200, partial [Fimbriimonadales bacterium]